MTRISVDHIESVDPLKSVGSVKEREENECALAAESHRFAEEEFHRLQLMENAGITKKQPRELQRLREMDEEAAELQRLRGLEMARLAEEEVKRPREDRQQFEQSCNAADQAVRVAGEKEKEHKCMQKEEIDHIAAEEQESEPQHQEEKRVRIEAQEQAKRQDEERIRIADQGKKSRRRRAKRNCEEERETLSSDKDRKAEAAWTAAAEAKKQPGDPASKINKTPKMNRRVEEEEDDQQAVDVHESEDESEGESDDEIALEAARLAEARAANKKGRNKAKVDSVPTPSVGSTGMNTRPTHTLPISMPPMVHPPFHSHQSHSPFRPPIMSMHTSSDEQPLYPPSFSPVTTINVNSGNTSNFTASNINNNNSTKSELNSHTNTFIAIADLRPTIRAAEEKAQADENQDSECRRGEGAHVEGEEQLKCQEEKKTCTGTKDQSGEINKAKLASAPALNPTDSDSLKTSGKEEEEEEKLPNEAKNQPRENKTEPTSTPRPKPTNSDSLKNSGKSKEEVEKLASETWRAANKATKIKRASTPPAQRSITERASASTQRGFAKLNEGPSPSSILPVSQTSILHRLTHRRRRPDVETSTHRAWSRGQGDESHITPTPIPASAHQRLDDLGNRIGNPGVFQGDRYPYLSSTYASTLQHPSQHFSPYSVLEHNSHLESPVSASTPQYWSYPPSFGSPPALIHLMSYDPDPSTPSELRKRTISRRSKEIQHQSSPASQSYITGCSMLYSEAMPEHPYQPFRSYSALEPDLHFERSFDSMPQRLSILDASTTAEPRALHSSPLAYATPSMVGQPPQGMFIGTPSQPFNPRGDPPIVLSPPPQPDESPTSASTIQLLNPYASGYEVQDIKVPQPPQSYINVLSPLHRRELANKTATVPTT